MKKQTLLMNWNRSSSHGPHVILLKPATDTAAFLGQLYLFWHMGLMRWCFTSREQSISHDTKVLLWTNKVGVLWHQGERDTLGDLKRHCDKVLKTLRSDKTMGACLRWAISHQGKGSCKIPLVAKMSSLIDVVRLGGSYDKFRIFWHSSGWLANDWISMLGPVTNCS